MGRTRKRWSDAEETRLLELLAEQRYTYDEIAALLGRTKRAVEERIFIMDTPHRPLPEYYHRLCGLPPDIWKPAMLASGSAAEFAAAIGKSYNHAAAGLRRQYGTAKIKICKRMEGCKP